MTLAVPALNIRRFEVDWNSEGISPSKIPEHEEYINNLCREVEYLMKEKIIHSINKRIREDVSDPLYEEVVQHLKFCQTKCETFYGRKEILDRCKAYLQVNILHNCIGATLHLILSLCSTIILRKQKYKEIQQSAFLKLRTRSLQYILFRMIDVTRS